MMFYGTVTSTVTIDLRAMETERKQERERKLRYYHHMKALGIRGTSIQKYLRRGFPGPFVKVLQKEMAQLAEDFRRKWWLE
jgi:hypothetical protein